MTNLDQQPAYFHQPILLDTCVRFLLSDPNGTYLDCTMGGAGHSAAIAARLTQGGTLIAIDCDAQAIAAGEERLLGRYPCEMEIIRGNYHDLDYLITTHGFGHLQLDGIIFDLGVSSAQLDNPQRGFSYMKNGPLDMRMDQERGLDASYLVNRSPRNELAYIFRKYGEERWADRIAAFIESVRIDYRLKSTAELVEVIKMAIPAECREKGHHPAKRCFQALRIAVNDELEPLSQSLKQAVARLRKGGRICVLTFHSLEDRIVKETFAEMAKGCICPPDLPVCACHHQPELEVLPIIRPGHVEIAENPRARSCILRRAIKL